MPFIKLFQPKGEYIWNGRSYEANRVLEVTDKEAFYLVNEAKVAHGVLPEEKKRMDEQARIDRSFAQETEGKLKIAMVRLGGLGDSFLLACHAKAVKRRWPNSNITLYIRDKFEPIADMEAVDRSVVCGNANWWDLVAELRKKSHYDIIIDNRYATKIYYGNARLDDDKRETDKAFKPYARFYDEWIRSCHGLGDLKVSTFDLFYKSTGLVGGEDDIKFPLKNEHFKFSQLLSDQKYVTVHNGSDIARQTKCWPTSHWVELVKSLKERGYKVVQLGARYEEAIEGTYNLCGMASIFESVALISQAEFHVDTEGGLVHMAKGVGVRSIVIFGPTPTTCFHYESNLAVTSDVDCLGCWWQTDYWWRDCPRGIPVPPACMTEATPERVMAEVTVMEQLVEEDREKSKKMYDPNDVNEQFAMELELTEGHYKGEKHQWERVNIMMDAVKGPHVLEVGAGDGYCSLVLKQRGFKVTSTEVSKIRLDRMEKAGLNPIEAPVQDLPFPDASFDSVICGEVLEHIPNWWEGMKELERVLKPDGRLILSWPVHPDYDGLKMHLWSIRQHLVYRNKEVDFNIQVMERINRDGV